jgi:GNAT superfamily N-acetyltransferase
MRKRGARRGGGALATAGALVRERRFYDLLLTLAKRARPEWLLTLDHQRILELDEVPALPAVLRRLEVRPAGAGDEDLLQSIRRVPGSYRPNFDKGREALVAFARGEPAGVVWLWPQRRILYPRYAVDLRLDEGTLWGHFIYVKPEYRSLGVFPRLWHAAAERVRSRGGSRLLCMVDPSHAVSMQAHTSVGWRPVADLVSLRLLGLRAHVARRVPGRWRVGLGRWRFG